MLKSLRLQNFRGFTDHVVELTPFSLLIGQNNAGKTTIIEALRIVATAQARIENAKFEMSPDEYLPHISGPVFRFSLDTIDFDEENIHHNYGVEAPAVLSARLKNNCAIHVVLGSERTERFCQYQAAAGQKINSRAQGVNPKFRRLYVMPPIGSLLKSETERNERYLRKNINGYLSYRHIRNQMFEMADEFEIFKTLLEDTWDHIKVNDVLRNQGELQNEYHLNLRDGRYPAEVARVGSGLQAWIQTLWFIARIPKDSTIILDEPDVYLHADLQKKLIRILYSSGFRQVIVATHSIEMISDVSPDEIIEVRKRDARSRPISTTAEAQVILNQMGTSHHLQLSKLAKTGKILFLEGKDHQLLGQIARKISPLHSTKFERIPRFAIGGMGNWKRAAMTAKVLAESSGGNVSSYLVIDRDYFDDEYLQDIVHRSAASSLVVRHWQKKEIENYFLDPEVIWNYVCSTSSRSVTIVDIENIVNSVIKSMMEDLPAQVGQNFQLADRKLALTTALNKARDFILHRKQNGATDLDLISGKQAIGSISALCKDTYGVSFSSSTICRHMKLSQVPVQLMNVVADLCGDETV